VGSRTKVKANAKRWSEVVEETPEDQALREAEKAARLRTQELKPPPPYRRPKKPKPAGQTILCIGDPHATPGPEGRLPDNRRFEWLGRAITDIQPDVVWCAGDLFSFDSLERFSKPGSRAWFDGSDFHRDCDAGIDAMLRIKAQVDDFNRGRKKENRSEPERWILTLGNHEARIDTLLYQTPIGYRLTGLISMENLRATELGWETYPYLESVEVAGISFSHAKISGVMAKPIAGIQHASSLLAKTFKSSVVGHSHLADHAIRTSGDGKKMHGLVVGCYTEEEMSYAGEANKLWWRGLVVLRGCDGTGDMNVEWLNMDRVKELYA